MIPIRDENPIRITPIVNYILIGVNILVFIFQYLFLAGPAGEEFVYQFALFPAQVTAGLDLGDVSDILTSMFMHAGLAHIGGNMLYLWIFGDNIEEAMGSVKYLIFYLIGGFVASAAHILTNPTSTIPTVGASGAIAAVLGAYLILFPQSRVQTIIPLGYYMRIAVVPAIIVLGLWFVLQLFQGVLSLGGPEVGGVAFWAHIGGFVAGMLMAKLLASRRVERMPRF